MITSLSIEIVQLIAYELGVLSVIDIRNLCLVCKDMNYKLHGNINEINSYDLEQHKSLLNLNSKYHTKKSLNIAFKRGLSNVFKENYTIRNVYSVSKHGCIDLLKYMFDILKKKYGTEDLLNKMNKSELHSLSVAVENNNVKIIRFLLEEGVLFGAASFVLRQMVKKGNHELVEYILNSDHLPSYMTSPVACNNECIVTASRNNDLEMVKILLKDPRVDPSARRNESLANAIQDNNYELVTLLMSSPKINKGNMYELVELALNLNNSNSEKFVKILLGF